jgi:hypothetical protein
MGVIISGSLVVTDTVSGGGIINADNPLIGYQQLVTTSNVSATTEDTGFPATHLANPSTNLRWQGVTGSPEADEYITIAVNTAEDVDYVGIAHHNFYSAQIPVSIEVLDADASPETWTEIVADTIPPNDGPLLFRFTPQAISSIRIRMQPGDAAPYAAVVYVGKLFVLQRRLYVGHTPINYGRTAKITNARSESGNFLGRIVLNETTKTSVALDNLTPDWYRTYLDPFIAASKEDPFFFAWRPSTYPNEVGYVWMINDPQPSNQRPNGMMQVSLELGGIFE